jgi:hypothetical protein
MSKELSAASEVFGYRKLIFLENLLCILYGWTLEARLPRMKKSREGSSLFNCAHLS